MYLHNSSSTCPLGISIPYYRHYFFGLITEFAQTRGAQTAQRNSLNTVLIISSIAIASFALGYVIRQACRSIKNRRRLSPDLGKSPSPSQVVRILSLLPINLNTNTGDFFEYFRTHRAEFPQAGLYPDINQKIRSKLPLRQEKADLDKALGDLETFTLSLENTSQAREYLVSLEDRVSTCYQSLCKKNITLNLDFLQKELTAYLAKKNNLDVSTTLKVAVDLANYLEITANFSNDLEYLNKLKNVYERTLRAIDTFSEKLSDHTQTLHAAKKQCQRLNSALLIEVTAGIGALRHKLIIHPLPELAQLLDWIETYTNKLDPTNENSRVILDQLKTLVTQFGNALELSRQDLGISLKRVLESDGDDASRLQQLQFFLK